ncbi:MAG: PAS domain S-box protein [Gammaproteobacteria bacterium]|nr:PAS domain S-box protein [Gammaproteobacteria bacterium]
MPTRAEPFGEGGMFRVFMDRSPLLACIKDRDAVIRYANSAWAQRLGKPLHELLGRSEYELFSHEQVERFLRSDTRVFDSGETIELTEQGRIIDGEQNWWHVIKFPIDDENGERLLGMLALDVTDRVRVQTALAASEAHVKAVLDTAVDAIITIDTAGVVRSFNLAAARMFGYTAEEVVGNNVNMLMPEPYKSEHDSYVRNYLATGVMKIIGIGREVSARRKDRSEFPIDLAVSEVVGGGEHEFTGVIKDLTEKKRTQAELQEREAEARYHREQLTHLTRISTLGEMAAGIAHEINQPLTAISTYAQACQRLLVNADTDIALLTDTLDKIARQAQRGGDIIRRVRDMASHTHTQTHRSTGEINAIVWECVEMSAYEARVKGIEIALHLQENLPVIPIDAVQIQQVVLNLLRNSMDALQNQPGERRVDIRTDLDDEALCVSVADNGPGVNEAAAQHLFEHFFTTKRSGMGIGLSMSKSIIDAHGGGLRYEPGTQGAAFKFTLPLRKADD